MKFVVLGGNGFIGSYIVDMLVSRGYSVTVFDLGPEKFRSPLPEVEYIYGDVTDLDLLRKVFSGKDVLVHCVSTTVPYTSNKNIEYDIQSNLVASVNIFQIAVERQMRRIVYLSSGGAIYGPPKIVPIPETHPTDPISSYGITKLAIEKYLQYFSLNYGIEYNIVRPSNPYGPRQNPFGHQGVIPVFLNKVLLGEVLEVWGDPNISKDYLYISDLARAICDLAILPSSADIVNVGSGSLTSIRQIIDIISEVVGREIVVDYLPANKFDVKEICLDITKVKNTINFATEVTLKEGIARTWDFVRGLRKVSGDSLTKGALKENTRI